MAKLIKSIFRLKVKKNYCFLNGILYGNGVPFFQNWCIRMTTQLKEKHVLYMMGQHYMTHKINK
jgi:hypothetical protein